MDKNGNQILSDKYGTDGCVLIDITYVIVDFFMHNQIMDLFMLNNDNNDTTKYFMSLYALFSNAYANTTISGKVYSIDSKYNFNVLNEVNFIQVISDSESDLYANILPSNNNNTLIITWTNWNTTQPDLQDVLAQSWSVTNT
eukprot:233962_1